jgi:hypothetical protein
MYRRQARLHASFSDWYPRISPGTWHDATWVREMALAQLRKGGPHWQSEGRVLSELHFEFQGGLAGGGQGQTDRRMVPLRGTGTGE